MNYKVNASSKIKDKLPQEVSTTNTRELQKHFESKTGSPVKVKVDKSTNTVSVYAFLVD